MNIEVRGLDELYKRLGSVMAFETLRPPMVNSLAVLHRRFANYTQNNPRKPPGSTYTRTFDLARSIHAKEPRNTGRGIEGTISSDSNAVPYAASVYSARNQARVHRGRWPTDEQILDEETNEIKRLFQNAVDRALEG